MRNRSGIAKRIAVIGAAVVAFAGASAIAATPAHATPGDCSAYLAAQGFGGLEHGLACTLGDISYTLCTTQLTLLAVPPATADVACRLAAA
ncbi:hypothetical protein ACFQY4_00985 [Catellatospora bangladeshensis]|uniref:Uncharacterized protein n=1 Tax=Catellatospora bangladeshensis TaxID=310355 RepID=A0A8J3NHI8_9ACTN|nr:MULTISPECIES: hypothetical protein [Catellatospora]BCJ71601.1 hypothetical protein CS0771_11450 [Catellatospora sp. IY07-71]GIF81297.1 hypothetical protein Cba03nite_26460 [Catellatospora bangladeshensis]